MASSLDLSLDDLIKKNKKPSSYSPRAPRDRNSSGGRGGGFAGRGPGPARRLPDRSMNRISPYHSLGKAPDSQWQHDMYTESNGAGLVTGTAGSSVGKNSSGELGTKLHISNLDYAISNEDIKELFEEVGELKRYSINYDRSGRSKGTAEVVFAKHVDAIAAVKRYHDVQLDGKEMKIELVGSNIQTPSLPPPPPTFPFTGNFRTFSNNNFGNFNNTASRSGYGRGNGRGGTFGGRGSRERENRGVKKESKSAVDLDDELEKYMQTK